MIGLTALSSLRIAPGDLSEKMRSVLGQPLRREGLLAKLCVTGIVSCVGNAAPIGVGERTALIWGSSSGARVEMLKVLDEICGNNSLPMPFDFIASQCGVSAVYAARYVPSIMCGVHLPSGGNIWQQMLGLAVNWMEQGRYDRVLCGWVDEAIADAADAVHASDWILLNNAKNDDQLLARVGLSDTAEWRPTKTADAEFVPDLKRWLVHENADAAMQVAVLPVEFHRIERHQSTAL